MIKYVVKRFAQMIVVLFIVSLLVFLLTNFIIKSYLLLSSEYLIFLLSSSSPAFAAGLDHHRQLHTQVQRGCWGSGGSREHILMYSRNLFVLDFVRRFFVSCAQIFEAYAVRTLMKFGCDWRKISHKSKCKKDSESTFLCL